MSFAVSIRVIASANVSPPASEPANNAFFLVRTTGLRARSAGLLPIATRPSARTVRIGRERFYLWRAVDDEGEVLVDVLVQRRRNRAAALKLPRRLLKRQGFPPTRVTTDRLRSYGAAFAELGLSARHVQGLRLNNRAEVSHQPVRRRERKLRRFKSTGSAQCFLALHAAVFNVFNLQRHRISRPTVRRFRAAAFEAWETAADVA